MELLRMRLMGKGIGFKEWLLDHLLNPPWFCWCNVFESVDKTRIWLIDKLEVGEHIG